jgi:hypothetical protein
MGDRRGFGLKLRALVMLVGVGCVAGCGAILNLHDVPEQADGGDGGGTMGADGSADGNVNADGANPGDGSMDSAPVDGGADGNVVCSTCQLVALEPSVANTGDTITLEGTFGAAATVNFPGGASVQATVLGAHRATAVVPASATAGDLTVTTGSMTVGPVFFRRASFALGLQQFQQFDDQTNGARAMPSLVGPRVTHAALKVKDFVYVVGGEDGTGTTLVSVEAARINADGSLGPFATVSGAALATPRKYVQNAAVVVGGYIYVVGGANAAMPLASIERAPINADGSLGAFAAVPNVQLVHARQNHAVAVIGSSLVVIGGSVTTSPYFLDSVEAAPILPDGSLGAFAEVGHLQTARESHNAVVVGKTLYVLGGDATFGGVPAIASIETATIAGDGTLGTFAPAGQLATARQAAVVWQLGSSVFVGGGGGSLTSVESATVGGNGTLGQFTTSSAAALPIGVSAPSPIVAGNYAYAIGGATNTSIVGTVQRAQIDGSAQLATFTNAALTVQTPRNAFGSLLLGSSVYLLGGTGTMARLGSIDVASFSNAGALQPFALSAVSLPVPSQGPADAVVGSSIYEIGGNPAGSFTANVSRALVNPDGGLQTFGAAPSLVAMRAGASAVILGSTLYVVGGGNGGGDLKTVESATINSDGSLGTFATVGGVSLVTERGNFCVAVLGSYLYVIGGDDNTGPSSAVDRATINSDNTITTFTSQPTLKSARDFATCVVIGNALYMIGGYSTAPVNAIESATIGPDGSLGTFANVPGVTLPAVPSAQYALRPVVVGNTAYAFAGNTGTGVVGTISQATLQ